MQQAILAERRGGNPVSTATANAFVINLISSTTPVALTRPDHAGLKRFTFFVSRRREEGRERFRLHMGYFETQEEAEKLLDIVREIYPGAWAGLAPGRGLAAATRSAEPGAALPEAHEAAPASVERLTVVPTVSAAGAGAKILVAASALPSPSAPPRAAEAPTLALVPDEGRRLSAESNLMVESNPDSEQQAAARSLSNIREAIASLDDKAAAAPVLRVIPELKPAVIPTARPIPPKTPKRGASSAIEAPAQGVTELSDTAALRLLERGADNPVPAARSPLSPSAVATRPLTQQAAANGAHERPRDEKPCYAVQLIWSVQPIAMAQVPQLAIFSAYTLYGAEGNRDGRRWYGLRLGFFTDAVSAKQVAHYVRADFSTVSVVPVTVREREQAQVAASRPTGAIKPVDSVAKAAGDPAKAQPRKSDFAFIDDKEPLMIKGAKPEGVKPQGAKPRGAVPLRSGVGARATRGAPGKRAKPRAPGQINAHSRAKPMTLEETLEILGAGQLQVDDEPGASINDSGVRHLRLESVKTRPSKLTRLFERLSERLGS